MLNIHKKLRTLIEGLLRQSQQFHELEISDITNAARFRELYEDHDLSSDDLTLSFNTDGSPVFKSSNTSVWPVQFIVNELPPDVRFQHPTLAGLRFGHDHPDMQAFLARFVGQINDMEPVVWDDGMALHRSKAYALCCSVDAFARASVLNMIRFNGLSGCPWCLIQAKHEQGSLRYFDKVTEPRTHESVIRDMLISCMDDDDDTTVNGFRGPSALMNLHGFDLVAGISVDYMHCVLLGVWRQVTDAWFNSKNSDLPFYADLYGATGATFNVHQLLHLASSVRNLGPLWANSAFVFEFGNGKIVKSVTAANGLPHQIVERVAMAQQLDLCVATLNITGEEREICEKFLGHTHVSNAVQIEDVNLLGLNRHADLSDTEKQLLHEVGYGSADCYDRFM
ncbi:uncharacterized protein LOC144164841 [Haemaphysalis longicornis]